MKIKIKKKVLDLRTKRGIRILEDLQKYYPSMYYGLDKDILFSEGFTHVIKNSGEIVVIFKGKYLEIE